jgi:hypothetical protein
VKVANPCWPEVVKWCNSEKTIQEMIACLCVSTSIPKKKNCRSIRTSIRTSIRIQKKKKWRFQIQIQIQTQTQIQIQTQMSK